MSPLSPKDYEQPFIRFMTDNPTVFHAVNAFEADLTEAGFQKLSERVSWSSTIKLGGKYYVTRNDSSLIAFTVGRSFKPGNGISMVGGHIDANTLKLKPISEKPVKGGYVQLGIAPYGGPVIGTWWDRDLGVAGKVLVKDSDGRVVPKLVNLGWPIARIPSLAPHLSGTLGGPVGNIETEMVPIIGLDNSDLKSSQRTSTCSSAHPRCFADTQAPTLVGAICSEMSIEPSSIQNWELELYDVQPAQLGGVKKEFIFAGRLDDKLCSWAAIQALLASVSDEQTKSHESSTIKLVAVFDNEEIGSLTRQGANSNFLQSTISRAVEALSHPPTNSSSSSRGRLSSLLAQSYANSFLVSSDVTHAGNPNYTAYYMASHTPRLNVGVAIKADANGHMTTDGVSSAILQRIAARSGNTLQVFMAPGYSGGTIGPMLSSAMGVRAIDVGIPQLSMHSVRATTGNLDPGLGVLLFKGVFDEFMASLWSGDWHRDGWWQCCRVVALMESDGIIVE